MRKKALILRVGGLGDLIVLTPIAKKLNQKYDVDFFAGSPTGPVYKLLEKLPYLKNVKQVVRLNGIDCVQDENQHWISVEILKDNYDEVFDYKFSIEDNRSGLNKDETWRHTINSNYVNWMDLFFAWANIDPEKVLHPEHHPEYILPDEKYIDWVVNETPIGRKDRRNYIVIGIQLQASSLMRTWYKAGQLPKMIHEKYPDAVVCIYTNKWVAITRNGTYPINFPDNLDPLICSVALISQLDVFIGADTGMSHIAEAAYVQHITVYTTVPAWTRSKWYMCEHALQPDVECHPCFTLDLFCPLEKQKARESLTEREKDIIKSSDGHEDIGIVATRYNTVPRAIQGEFEAAQKRIEALSATEPACVRSITPQMILDKLDYIISTYIAPLKQTGKSEL